MTTPAPTKERTWVYSLNNFITPDITQAGGTDDATNSRKNLWLGIKDKLLTLGLNPWTVTLSHGILTGAGAGDNIGNDINELEWASGTSSTRSWIVYRNTALGMELLFDCVSDGTSDGANADAFIAPVSNPFTGGTPTARPTSTSEVRVLDSILGTLGAELWGSGVGSPNAFGFIYHVMQADDGLSTRVFIQHNGDYIGFWLIDQIADAPAGMEYPWVVNLRQRGSDNSSGTPYVEHFGDDPRAIGKPNEPGDTIAGPGGDCTYWFGSTGFDGADNQLAVNDAAVAYNPYDNKILFSEIRLISQTASWVGEWGRIKDMWYAPQHAFLGANNRFFGGSKDFIQIGHFLFPWDGSTIPSWQQ